MRDIIITGKQGSGKTAFAQKYFSEDYTRFDDMPLEEIKKLATSVKPKNGNPCVFLTEEPIDFQPGRRFILIHMPDNG